MKKQKDQQYFTARQIIEKYQITSQTLYNWRNANKIPFFKLPSGSYAYSLPIIENSIPEKQNVLYARVSNTKQKDDLERQIQLLRSFMAANGVKIDAEYSDIASGMNENRKDFNKLIDECLEGNISKIYVTYKDRFVRFGFGYFERILNNAGVIIEVINATKEEDFQQELVQDFVSVIHHFSMKMYSNRRKILNGMKKEIENTK
jgi:putative resolvase